MEAYDISRYEFLNQISRIRQQEFIEKTKVYSMNNVQHFFGIKYIREEKGSCYELDLIKTMLPETSNRGGWLRASIKFDISDRFIEVVGKPHPILFKNIKLTNKGEWVLDQYTIWIQKLEREAFYTFKENNLLLKKNKYF